METKIIGNKIAEARKQLNMSQAQLAERLFISPQAVGKWERSESMPDITTFGRMARILGVDLNYFSANGEQETNGQLAAYGEKLANGQQAANGVQPETGGMIHDPSPEHTATNVSGTAPNSARDDKKRPVRNMSTNTWKDVDFSGLNNIRETVNAANFQNCKFLASDLKGLVWKNDVLHHCDFSRSNLNRCRFQGSNLEGTRFNGCSLVEADFSSSTIKKCNFEGADLTKTFFNFSSISRIRVQDAIWKGTAFKDSQIEDVVFEGNIENCHFEKCGFKGVEFRNVTLINTFFKYNNNLKKAVFTNCKVDSLTFAFLKSDKANVEGLTLIQNE
jgi:uncharacterized protein YjbI with pentapeptide repeats/transcriptional regulator with XRE-family HTH domain